MIYLKHLLNHRAWKVYIKICVVRSSVCWLACIVAVFGVWGLSPFKACHALLSMVDWWMSCPRPQTIKSVFD